MAAELHGARRRMELIDRRHERGVFDRLAEAVRAGERRALVVSGVAGVGKRALLEYLAEQELTTIGSEDTLMTQHDEYRSLYLSYLKYCNEHDFDGMASFYTSPIKVNDVPMDPAAVTAQFAPLISAFPDWHWEMRHLVVDGDYLALHFTVTGTHRGAFQGIEATGRRVTTSEFTLYRLQDRKFAEVWDLTDMDAVTRQIGQGEAR
jgi:predicted ester cyclase